MSPRLKLFVGCLFVIALLTKTDPGSAHEYSPFGTVESLIDRATFQLDDSSFIGTVDKIYRNGHYYSHQPPLLPVLEAPVYWAIHLPGIRFNNRGRFVMTYLFILFTNGLALALTVVVFASILRLAGVAEGTCDWLAALLVFGTWLLPYGISSNNHGVSALLLCVLIWLLWPKPEGISVSNAAAIGVTVGLLVAIEVLPLVSFVPVVLAGLAVQRELEARRWAALGAAFAAPLVVHAIFNVGITGDVIPAGFHHELFVYQDSFFDPNSLSGTIKFVSVGAFAEYVWTAMFAGRGYFTFAPLLILSIVCGLASWQWWERARTVQLMLLAGVALSLGAALVTTNQYGGVAVGFRHGAYLVPALLTLLLPWVAGASTRGVVSGVAIVSTASMLLFAVRQPWAVLTLSNAPIGTWDQYVPIIGKIVDGNLFNP